VWLLNGQFDRFRMQERAFWPPPPIIVSCARAGCGLPPGSAARSTPHACCSVFSTGGTRHGPRHCWIADALVSFMVGLRETFGN
jgi:hypothetical protein